MLLDILDDSQTKTTYCYSNNFQFLSSGVAGIWCEEGHETERK